MIQQLFSEAAQYKEAVERRLDGYLRPTEGCPPRLLEAMRYSVLAPGKRFRPLLCLCAAQAIGNNWNVALPAACAVELVHVYSLIHDDLPSMDDDDLRRGQPTCHIKFDEATAVLAGDSLQMLALNILARDLPPQYAGNSCRVLSAAAGHAALVGGQMDDLAAEGRFDENGELGGDLESLKAIHLRKTGALIAASLELGGMVAGASDDELDALKRYGRAVGLAFQIVDDCLDVESTAEQMGKNTRKDDAHGKLTYPSLLGLEASRKMAADLIDESKQAVAFLGQQGASLNGIADFVLSRSS